MLFIFHKTKLMTVVLQVFLHKKRPWSHIRKHGLLIFSHFQKEEWRNTSLPYLEER